VGGLKGSFVIPHGIGSSCWGELKHVKVNDMIIKLCLHQFSYVYFIFTIKRSINTKVQLTMGKLIEKFKGLCRNN